MKTRPIAMRIALSLAAFLMASCEATVNHDLPPEFDLLAEVIAIVMPDSVSSGLPFTVQVAYPRVCGGTFRRFDRTLASDRVTLHPVLHVVTQTACPQEYVVETENTQVVFDSVRQCVVVVSGRFADLGKFVQVVAGVAANDQYRFHFQFRDFSNAVKTDFPVVISFPDRQPPDPVTVHTDSNGVWETAFADTLGQMRYTVAGMNFLARRGVKETGIVILP